MKVGAGAVAAVAEQADDLPAPQALTLSPGSIEAPGKRQG